MHLADFKLCSKEQLNSSYDEPPTDNDSQHFPSGLNISTFEYHECKFSEMNPPPIPPHNVVYKANDCPSQTILPPKPPERKESLRKLSDEVISKSRFSANLEDVRTMNAAMTDFTTKFERFSFTDI
ncbi:unnamed protein product [Rodentolepis nana]|uniref:UMA domain-containing protein n=1 Tax=Rodentolepis nana TaxID=102285 RepID=A0A0R3TS65_RODNA|nr:unnamed protein product [Rodentolepis nana]